MSDNWDWSDLYEGHQKITLLLPDHEAQELLDQASLEGRLVAPNVVKGMPSIVFGEEENAPPLEPVPANDDKKESKKGDAPDPKISILPVVQRQPLEPLSKPVEETSEVRPKSRIFAEQPPVKSAPTKAELEQRKTNKELSEIAAEALKSGKVKITKCPPMTYSDPEAVTPKSGWGSGGKGNDPHTRKSKRLRKARAASLSARDGEKADG